MKYLIDECLSPELAGMARDHGHSESTHVTWLGLAGQPDHVITRRAVYAGYVLVTHNTVDFRRLYARQGLHVGLVTFNMPARAMSLALQKTAVPAGHDRAGRRGSLQFRARNDRRR